MQTPSQTLIQEKDAHGTKFGWKERRQSGKITNKQVSWEKVDQSARFPLKVTFAWDTEMHLVTQAQSCFF